MATAHIERRLAAIMASDIAGYSRLMEADESGTLAAIKDLRGKVLEPLLTEYGGRIIKLMGDGALLEFGSAIDAVVCAATFQKEVSLNQQYSPSDRRIAFRVGINIGDVVVEGDDLYGDGVNIAVRLETIAPPGGISISDAVQRQLAGKTDLAFEDIGEQKLKNIARPVRVWRWIEASGAAVRSEPLPLSNRPSIAVLPFVNLSGHPEETYFSDGITEEIIAGLARFRSLFVIARNSSFAFRGEPVDIAEIGRKLGVSYLVEGSVRRVADRVRITAQLTEAATGAHLWAERYDRSVHDVFAVQDEVAQMIAAALFGRVQEADVERSSRKPTESLTAYDCLLRGLAHLRAHAEDESERALELFEKAVALDGRYALAHTYLALMRVNVNGIATAPREVLDMAFAEARHAIELDPQEGRCHRGLSTICLYRREYDMAEHHVRRALDLNPNDADALMTKGRLLSLRGNPREGLACMEAAVRLNPLYPPSHNAFFVVALYSLRRFDEAVLALKQMPNSGPWGATWWFARLAACYAQLDRIPEARAAVADVIRLQPDFSTAEYMRKSVLLEREEDRELLREGLLKAGFLQ